MREISVTAYLHQWVQTENFVGRYLRLVLFIRYPNLKEIVAQRHMCKGKRHLLACTSNGVDTLPIST
uniref:hypothetical protein n=1 Tax=Ningiella ruwaisensis TaxID=2364274 RepID=UPI00109F60B3|nr:hypothetical protein [Ningiella ruwaisensis]